MAKNGAVKMIVFWKDVSGNMFNLNFIRERAANESFVFNSYTGI